LNYVDSTAGGHSGSAELLHFSESADHKIISILFFDKSTGPSDEDGDTLRAMYFTKDSHLKAPATIHSNTVYNYLFGPNIKMAWPTGHQIPLGICGAHAAQYVDDVFSAAQQWNKVLPSKQKIKVIGKNPYPPFSDLSQHCVYVVESYLAHPNPEEANYGATFNVADTQIRPYSMLIFFYSPANLQRCKFYFCRRNAS